MGKKKVAQKIASHHKILTTLDCVVKYGCVFTIVGPILCVLLAILLQEPFGYNKEGPIDAILQSGTRPPVLPSTVQINRSDIVKLLETHFISQNKTNLFGAVLGPSGVGKTYLTRLACNIENNHEGVLYFEIADPNFFPERLARKIGMKLVDDTHSFDILLEKVGIKYANFYRLPQNLSLAMSYVLDTLAERGAIYKKEHDYMPCLFIDGVDLLAKMYPEIFVTLINLAKHYSNNAVLRIVFVSRDSIIPLLDSTTSQIWQADVIEVMDIGVEDAVDYLTQNGMPVNLANRVFNYTGGRFILLINAIDIYGKLEDGLNENEIYYDIRGRLSARCYGKNRHAIVYKKSLVKKVLR